MPRAERDFVALYDAIDGEHSDAARRWFSGLQREANPLRSPVTPENKNLRHLLYGRKPHVYRVIYRIVKSRGEVQILHIRHGVRDRAPMGTDTL
jgi:toxin ParE1/3/4